MPSAKDLIRDTQSKAFCALAELLFIKNLADEKVVASAIREFKGHSKQLPVASIQDAAKEVARENPDLVAAALGETLQMLLAVGDCYYPGNVYRWRECVHRIDQKIDADDYLKEWTGPANEWAEMLSERCSSVALPLLGEVSVSGVDSEKLESSIAALADQRVTARGRRRDAKVYVEECARKLSRSTMKSKIRRVGKAGISMAEAALILSRNDDDLAKETKARWLRQKAVKRPRELGKHQNHKQQPIYDPHDMFEFIKSVEPGSVAPALLKRLKEAARLPR